MAHCTVWTFMFWVTALIASTPKDDPFHGKLPIPYLFCTVKAYNPFRKYWRSSHSHCNRHDRRLRHVLAWSLPNKTRKHHWSCSIETKLLVGQRHIQHCSRAGRSANQWWDLVSISTTPWWSIIDKQVKTVKKDQNWEKRISKKEEECELRT